MALSTFPAAWVGREPSAIAAGLADLLVGSLYLDFAFVRLGDPKGGASVEVTRGDGWRAFPEWLQRHPNGIGYPLLSEVIPDVDGGAEPCRGIIIPIGADSQGGLVAAASGRSGFPDEIDRLLLSVAANQAATACENARLLDERRRAERALRDARNELERKVAERTAELRRTTADLLEREARIRRLVDANIIGIVIWNLEGQVLDSNDAFLRMVGYDREDLLAGHIRWTDLTPPEFRDRNTQAIEELKRTGTSQPTEKEYFRKDGSRVPVLMGRATFEDDGNQGVAFVLDLTERKRAEEALRASEQRFRDYAEVASDWFRETGPDHRFTEFSRTAADWELPADLVGKTRWNLAADREKEPEKWRAHVATLEAHQPFRDFRYRIPRLVGSSIYVSVSGKPVFDGSGAFLGYRGVATDVSAEVRADKALRDSEERFRTLMQFSFDVYWETDAQHRFIRQDFSERVTDGPLPGSELGKRRWELPYLDIDEEGWRKHRETLDAHLPFRDLEYGRPTPNGGKRYAAVSGLPMFDEAGRFIGYRGIGRHITERKQMEEALRQREKELREILETIPAMTVTILADGSDVIIGKQFSEYSGLSVEEARGSGWKAVTHPDDVDLHLRKWRASLASGEPREVETRFRRAADGEYRWFLARAVPFRDDSGNILRWYEVLTDIEDRKRAEQARRRSEAYLAEAQRLSHTGSFAYHPSSRKTLFWSEELFRIFELDPRHGIPDYDETRRLVHPDDLETVSATCLQGFCYSACNFDP